MAVSLLCLVGIPGSGKTTLARAITNYLKNGRDVIVASIEYDFYIEENVYAQGNWKSSRNDLLTKIENCAEELSKKGCKGLIILDDNFYYRSMRYDVYKIARKLKLGFGQVFLDIPLEVCISRDKMRTNPLNPDVIVKMNSLLEPPDSNRNSWEMHSVQCSGEPNLETIYNLITTTWENPCVQETPTEFTPQENSNVHYADLALRQIVKSMVKSTPKHQLTDLTRSLAQKKKRILEDIKTMNLKLPSASGNDSVHTYVDFLTPYMTS